MATQNIQRTNHSQRAPSCHIINETNLWACLGYQCNPGVTGKGKTHRQGDIHVGEIICLLLQRVNPQLSFLPAAGGGRPVSLQETLPPLVRVHLCRSPPAASCWLSRGHLGEEKGGRQWILLGWLLHMLNYRNTREEDLHFALPQKSKVNITQCGINSFKWVLWANSRHSDTNVITM